MTVEIDFPMDRETEEDLERVHEIDLVFMRFDFFVDSESVFEELVGSRYFGDFFYMFLKVCLKMLPRLQEGRNGDFGFEGSIYINFEPDGETVTTYLSERYGNRSGDRYEMDLQEFAREVIETSSRFITWALYVRPDEQGTWREENFREVLEDAKAWYHETYDERI